MLCDYLIIESGNKELECRKIIMQSIDDALKKGDAVFEKLISRTEEDCKTSYDKFKKGLSKIEHQNLKK